VAVLLERATPELFVAQLGVWKAGAAWTCIDPAFPDEHARSILEDVDADVLPTGEPGARRAASLGVEPARVLRLESVDLAVEAGERSLPQPDPDHLAYVIYTSGTTGRPKGVEIEHASIAGLVASDLEDFDLGPGDRVAQGSSPAYDSSLEETWLAFACGATLVVLDDRAARLGPDLVSWLRRERINVLCPPPTLLRSTGCADPERELPDLRLLYVGGEALPEDVAALWGRGRRLVNGYGPTEATVTVVRGDVRPGGPVVIGKPVRGNTALVLDADLREVGPGEAGELFVGGPSLARGYRGAPELTAERFPEHPRFGRLFRTGDRVRSDEAGELVYLGRVDEQVKLRGHRIELGDVEARLAALPGVREAACAVQRRGARRLLAGFLVPADGGAPPDLGALRASLAASLPAHMVPSRLALIEALPTSVGGKLDRARLPVLGGPAREGELVPPRDPLEARVAEAFRATLELDGPVSVEDDFFLDLGGDSLAAAELVSALRDDPRTAMLAVRDLYEAKSAAALAGRARRMETGVARTREPRPAGEARGRPLAVTAVQTGWLALELLAAAAVLLLAVYDGLPWLARGLGVGGALLAAPFLALALTLVWAPLAVALTAAAKRVLLGAYRPGRAPAWGSFHLRHWIVSRLARRIPWGLLSGTVLSSAALRGLGARVGQRVHVHRGVNLSNGGWDLLELGDDAVLSQDASLRPVDLADGHLEVGPVRVAAGAALERRAGVSPGGELGEGAILGALSWLAPDARVPAGERWDGVPAGPAGEAPSPPPAEGRGLHPGLHAALLIAVRTAAGALLAMPLILLLLAIASWTDFDGPALEEWLSAPLVDGLLALAMLAGIVAAVPVTLVLQALLVRAVGPARTGALGRWSGSYLRVWIATELTQIAGTWLSGTLFWPPWLRLAGMRVGRNCEVSTVLDLLPQLVELGDACFLADGVYLGGPRVRSGVVELARTELGSEVFLGNHAVVPPGVRLPDGLLVGVCTVADPEVVRGPGAWFGHPAFELARPPQRELDRRLTHDPHWIRRLNRLAWEALRFALPAPILALGFGWLWLSARGGGGVAAMAAAILAAGAAAGLAILALKWLLLGRVRPGRHPLWSCWCSRWDFLYVAWRFLARGVLAQLEGTLLLAPILRAFGARIGRRALLGGGFAQVVDPDMLDLEEGATVNGLFQAHTFEDRVLKIGCVRVRRGATLGASAVLFYGVDVGEGARVAPHGVVSKGERLPGGRDYAGVPTRPV